MKNPTIMSTKRVMPLALATVLVFSGINTPVTKESVNNKSNNQSSKSVYNEIQKSVFSTEELNKISEAALNDGESTAKKINELKDENDFEAAVNYAMTAYYKNEDFAEMAEFEAAIDDRSKTIVKGYKDAAEERAKGDSNGYEVGTVLLSFDKTTTREEIKAIVEAEYGKCRDIFECFNGDYMVTVDISLGQTVAMAEDAYAEYSITEIAEANKYMEVAESVGSSINDSYRGYQYYLDKINARDTWDYISQRNHKKVVVGVLDGGIQLDHPDLDAVISPKSADFTLSSTKATLLSELSTPYTTDHGTKVSGIIAAEANNSWGVAGVASCYNNDVVEILMAQVMIYNEETKSGTWTVNRAVRGMNYCVENGAKVINLSGSGSGTSTIMDKAIDDVTAAGAIFVCSAGNTSKDEVRYPSSNDSSISVISTTSSNTLSSFSTYGMDKDFAAPGSGIYTTTINSGIASPNGTSFSAPIVAAIVAMMCSVNPSLTYTEVYEILAKTAKDIGLTGKSKYGLVDAYAAVKMANEEYPNSQETTTVPVTTKAPETTTVPMTTKEDTKPLEVFGVVVSSPANNTVGVVWGQDAERIQKKYKYNVYVNGEKKLSQVDCNYYTISKVDVGTVTVKITAVLNGLESTGVTYTVDVKGAEETTTVVETTTKAPETTTIEETTTRVPETTTVEETTKAAETTTAEETTSATKVYQNVALNKTVTASSVQNVSSTPAANVVDGKNGTYWTSATMAGQWITVDLGKEHYIDGMNIIYNKFLISTYEIMVSADGMNWTTVATASSGTINTTYENMGLENVRYVKLNYPNNTTSISVSEIKVMGEETEVETTVPETTEQETTAGVAPLEVIGALMSSPADNTIFVVWGQDGERIASGCKYNVYVNGELKLSQVECNAYTITGVSAGNATVKITAVLGAVESAGVTQTVAIAGKMVDPVETTTEEVTTEEITTVKDNVNLSVGKVTYSSSVENGDYVANLATDGNSGTRWSSAWSDNEWIYVDLGSSKYVSYVEFDWEAAYATVYQVQISADGYNWTTVNTVTSGRGGKERTEVGQNARYVKMQGVNRSTTYGYSLFEMSVFGH